MPISFFEWSKTGQNAPTMIPTSADAMNKAGNTILERNEHVGVMHPGVSHDARVPEATRDTITSFTISNERMNDTASMNQRPTQPVATGPPPISTRDLATVQDQASHASRIFQTCATAAVPVSMFESIHGKDKRAARSITNADMSTIHAGASSMQGPVYEADPTRMRRSQLWTEAKQIDGGILVDKTPKPIEMDKEQQHTRLRKSNLPSTEMQVEAVSMPQGIIASARPAMEDEKQFTRSRKSELPYTEANPDSTGVRQYNIAHGPTMEDEKQFTRSRKSELPSAEANPDSTRVRQYNIAHGPAIDEDKKSTRFRKSELPSAEASPDSTGVRQYNIAHGPAIDDEKKFTRSRKSELPSTEINLDSTGVPHYNIAHGRRIDHDQTLVIREKKTQMEPIPTATSTYADTNVAAPPLEVATTSVATRDNRPTKDVTSSLLDRSAVHTKDPIPIQTERPATVRMEGNMPRYTQPIHRMNEIATHGTRKSYGPTEVASMHVSDKSSSRGAASNASDMANLTDFQASQRNVKLAQMDDQGPSATRTKDGSRRVPQTNIAMHEAPLQAPPVASIPIESNLRNANVTKSRESQRGVIDSNRLDSGMMSATDMDKIGTLVSLESKLASANARMLYDEKTIGREKEVPDSYFKPHAEWQSMHDISGEQRPNATRLEIHNVPKTDQIEHLRMAVSLNQRPFPNLDMQSRLAQGREINVPLLRKDARISGINGGDDTMQAAKIGLDRALKPVDVEFTLLRGMPIKEHNTESATERTARAIISTSKVRTESWVRGGEDTRSAYKQPAKYIKNMAV